MSGLSKNRLDVVKLSEDEKAVVILDQTRLPNHEEYLRIHDEEVAWKAIKLLQVRGAPAIGVFAGYAVYVLAQQYADKPYVEFAREFQRQAAYLNTSRPTAVNLSWALKRQLKVVEEYEAYAENPEGYAEHVKAAASGAAIQQPADAVIVRAAELAEAEDYQSVFGGDFDAAAEKAESAFGAASDSAVSKLSNSRELVRLLGEDAKRIDAENEEMTRKIAEYGVTLIRDGDGILTHCNAGYLACLGYGTATAPIYYGAEQGMKLHVFSDETRPLLQGARLTSYELAKSGIDVTLICDNMASIVMKQGWVNAVFVGCDRIAANGDFANKIGTSGVAILAKHYGVPFYTLGPSSTIDFNTPTGDDIHIEQRDPDEVKTMWYKEPMALPEVKCYNPSFDVTDHNLVTGIVTERGIVYPPFEENLKKLFNR